MNELDSQLLVITKQEYDNWQNTIKTQSQKIDACDYIIHRFGDVQKYKDLFDSPCAPVRLKLSRKDTWETLIEKLIKAQHKGVKTRK